MPPPNTASLPSQSSIDPRELTAERELFDILIVETQQLGKHGATPARRTASGRVETKLTLLRDQLPA